MIKAQQINTAKPQEFKMKNESIRKILENHSVPCYEKDGHIFADAMISGSSLFEEVEDLTGYTKKKIYEWLGY